MEQLQIYDFQGFCAALVKCGFTVAGKDKGVFSLIPWGWDEQPPYPTPVCWHTGDPETDPWQWRVRVLRERDDIAYGKFFFSQAGYITKEWFPFFLSARRNGLDFEDFYRDGRMSHASKRIYDVLICAGPTPVHEIKQLAGFGKEEKSVFDRALTELQMNLMISICDCTKKTDKFGKPYGWDSTVIGTVEQFWGDEIIELASRISPQESCEKITDQIITLNPQARERKIHSFIYG